MWSAGTVKSGEAIVAADDDGTNVRTLVTAAQLGMDAVRAPDVRPDGRTVVFTGETGAFTETCNVNGLTTTFFGYNAVSLFAWTPETGAFRLTQQNPQAGVLATECESLLRVSPSIGPDGRTYSVAKYSTSLPTFDYDLEVQDTSLRSPATDMGITCSSGRPDAVAADPSSAGRVLFTGCSEGAHALVLARAGEGIGSGAIPVLFDDAEFRDPAFSADGRYVVDSEDGADAGIWLNEVKPADPTTATTTHLLTAPATGRLESPALAFAGESHVLFTHADGGTAHLRALDLGAACLQTPPCVFPQGTTAITSAGTNSAADWTRDPLVVAAPPSPPPAPGTAPSPAGPGPVPLGTAPGTGTTPGIVTPSGVPPTPTATTPVAGRRVTVPARITTAGLAKGQRFAVRVRAKGRVTVSITLPASRVGRRGRRITVATGRVRAARAGTVRVTVRLTRTGRAVRRRLPGLRATLVATQGRGKTTRAVRLR